MVHIQAKFRENTSMRFRVTARKLIVMDRQTDRQTDGWMDGGGGGRCNIPIIQCSGDNGRTGQMDGEALYQHHIAV